ncbi:hypothetical protein [Streptomyces sp. NPDC002088]|uniref:hypothetical protein n=1 Tax=Streptomyces sp. NPDC002088 TaxID=3154665 RepID=UPI0033188EA6
MLVRHTGPEADLRFTRTNDLLLGRIFVVMLLDEHLKPVRRIGEGAGVHRVPPGLLQIRTIGSWRVEPER